MPNPKPPNPDPADSAPGLCPSCGKPGPLCVCDEIAVQGNKIELLILQHPQEQDRELGTAALTVRALQRASLRVGLSWPSLAAALGRPAEPRRWAVLYLGSAKPTGGELVAVDAAGAALPDQRGARAGIEGIVLLDGSWSQAKTLWWRNPWVLKCRRLVLDPATPSRYGKLRREPRREGLSTLEAAALTLSRLEDKPALETALLADMERLLHRYRALHPNASRRPGRRPISAR